MSQLILAESATPSTPASGKASVFFGTDNRPKIIDENGTAIVFGANALASIVATSGGINSAETIVVSATIPQNLMQAGTTFRIRASGTCTSSAANASNFRMRLGTAGSSSDALIVTVTPTAAASGTNIPFWVELLGVIRTAGSGGTGLGSGCLNNNGTTGVSAAAVVAAQTTATVSVNTTVSNIIQLSYQAAASTTTCTFYNATIEIVKW